MYFLQKLRENCWRDFFLRIRWNRFWLMISYRMLFLMCTQEEGQTFLWISMQSSSLWTRREKMDPFHRCFRSIPKKVGWIDKKVWLFLAVGLANSITIFKENMTVIYNVHTITTVSKKRVNSFTIWYFIMYMALQISYYICMNDHFRIWSILLTLLFCWKQTKS